MRLSQTTSSCSWRRSLGLTSSVGIAESVSVANLPVCIQQNYNLHYQDNTKSDLYTKQSTCCVPVYLSCQQRDWTKSDFMVESQDIHHLHLLITAVNIMKKKLSLIIRRKPTRKKIHTHHSPSPSPISQQPEQCTRAKKYLFSLDEHPPHCQNYSRPYQFDTTRNQADLSISQWHNIQPTQSTGLYLSHNSLDLTTPKKHHFRVKTEHKDDEQSEEDLFGQIQHSPSLLSSNKLQTKMLRRPHKPQNLSQLETVSPRAEPPSPQQLSTISNKSQCINTIKLMIKDRKAKIKMNTQALAVSHFVHDLAPTPVLNHKDNKVNLWQRNKQKGSLTPNKTHLGLGTLTGQTGSHFQRIKIPEKKRKFDILFVRHKLHRREGVWADREQKCGDFFQIDGQGWVTQKTK